MRRLSHATGDYVFWLDADDVVEPAERVKLVALLAGLKRPARPLPEPASALGAVPGAAGGSPDPAHGATGLPAGNKRGRPG